jgi:stage II sporulation protein D
MRPSRLALVAVVSVALALPTPAAAQARQKKRFGAVVAPIRLIPTSAQPIDIANHHSFFGTVELGSFGDGLAVINDVSFERYLLGLQEVPVSWPMEALRAQATAARTYALWTLERPPAGSAAVYGFDICATVQCQVFSGADVLELPDGHRWTEAVRSTAGEVILYANRPILARYHSTSGGATLDNSQAFPTERDYPYLQGVSSTTEQRAPLYRWRVQFSLPQMQAMLTNGGIWEAAFGRLEEVRSRPSASGLHYPDIVFIGSKGRTFRTAEELRDVVRDQAPALFPGRYPSAAPTASGILPETFPSNRLDITTRNKVVHVLGRGWGHGTGMSQWGAEGLARRGFSYIDILSHYYTGVAVAPYDTPQRIRVGTATGLSTATATGAFRIVDGTGRTIVPDALGTWTFHYGGSGAGSIVPPRGFSLPLKLGVVRAPKEVMTGKRASLRIALSRPARVQIVTKPSIERTEPVVRSAGKTQIAWKAPKEPGTYTLQVEAVARSDRRRSPPVEIVVREPRERREREASEARPQAAEEERVAAAQEVDAKDEVGTLGLIALAVLLAVAVATVVLAAKIDSWAKQKPPSS